jgi:hypothetical protein
MYVLGVQTSIGMSVTSHIALSLTSLEWVWVDSDFRSYIHSSSMWAVYEQAGLSPPICASVGAMLDLLCWTLHVGPFQGT